MCHGAKSRRRRRRVINTIILTFSRTPCVLLTHPPRMDHIRIKGLHPFFTLLILGDKSCCLNNPISRPHSSIHHMRTSFSYVDCQKLESEFRMHYQLSFIQCLFSVLARPVLEIFRDDTLNIIFKYDNHISFPLSFAIPTFNVGINLKLHAGCQQNSRLASLKLRKKVYPQVGILSTGRN